MYGDFLLLDSAFAGQSVWLTFAYFSKGDSGKYARMELSRMAYSAGLRGTLDTTDDLIGAVFKGFMPVGKFVDHDDYHCHIDHYEEPDNAIKQLHSNTQENAK